MRCGQEMCPDWPGEGCLSGVADCPDPDAAVDFSDDEGECRRVVFVPVDEAEDVW